LAKADDLTMPYFITDSAEGCSGWATIKDDGEVIGCHTTKQDAIDQMVAVSVAEDIAPGGERALNDELEVGDYVFWDNAGQTMYGEITSVSTFGAVKNPLGGDITATQDRPLATIQVYTLDNGVLNETPEFVVKGFAPLTKMDYEGQDEMQDDQELLDDEIEVDDDLERAINQDAPAYMRAAARRGLEYNAEGLGGDGLVERTIREARLMADGQVSDDKWIRIAAWIARHLVDLDSPDADPNSENYPSAGVVAHLLWGSGPSKRQAQRALEYAQGVVERIRAEERTANDLQNEKWRSITLNLKKDEGQSMTTNVERRVNTVEFDVRNGEASSDGMSFTGYAAVFNSPSEPLPFTEVIKEGAFKRSLKSRNEIKLFMNHNTDVVLGSTRAGTLKLTEDSRGLLAQAELPDTTAGRDLSVLMQRGDVSSMSFGFSVPPKGDSWSSDGATRELHQVRLHEVSIVTGFPAYEATTASVRSLDILAERTAVDVDALSDAILKLEAGETLDDTHADLISEVVQKLRADKPADLDLLEIKRKQLDLMLKAF
jgi:HK97 family phage prohead protease